MGCADGCQSTSCPRQSPVDDCDSEERLPGDPIPQDCSCGDCFCRGALPIDHVDDGWVATDLVSFLNIWVELNGEQVDRTGQTRFEIRLETDSRLESRGALRAALSLWLL